MCAAPPMPASIRARPAHGAKLSLREYSYDCSARFDPGGRPMTIDGVRRPLLAPATRVIVRVALYYAVLLGISAYAWRHLPRTQVATLEELAGLLGGVASARGPAAQPAAPGSLADPMPALTVTLGMLAAALLALPVAWVYLLTRAKRGYQQSVVHTLVILPMVVAGIVVL